MNHEYNPSVMIKKSIKLLGRFCVGEFLYVYEKKITLKLKRVLILYIMKDSKYI